MFLTPPATALHHSTTMFLTPWQQYTTPQRHDSSNMVPLHHSNTPQHCFLLHGLHGLCLWCPPPLLLLGHVCPFPFPLLFAILIPLQCVLQFSIPFITNSRPISCHANLSCTCLATAAMTRTARSPKCFNLGGGFHYIPLESWPQ